MGVRDLSIKKFLRWLIIAVASLFVFFAVVMAVDYIIPDTDLPIKVILAGAAEMLWMIFMSAGLSDPDNDDWTVD